MCVQVLEWESQNFIKMLGCCFRRTRSTGHLLYDIGVTYLPECYYQNFNNLGINSIDYLLEYHNRDGNFHRLSYLIRKYLNYLSAVVLDE